MHKAMYLEAHVGLSSGKTYHKRKYRLFCMYFYCRNYGQTANGRLQGQMSAVIIHVYMCVCINAFLSTDMYACMYVCVGACTLLLANKLSCDFALFAHTSNEKTCKFLIVCRLRSELQPKQRKERKQNSTIN